VIFLHAALALLILAIGAFAPGFFLLRRLRWNPLEKFSGSVVVSLVVLWLAAWILYLAGSWRAGSIAISLACAVLAALAWSDIRRLFASDRVRVAAGGFAFLLLWGLVLLATVRHYSGGTWFGDWLEHFQRTLVFFQHRPAASEIFGGYRIPSRPPLAHVITAFVMAQTEDSFEIYQIAFCFLSLLAFLPCCLLLPRLARPWKSGVVPLAGIFALSPVFMVNATWTGTKPIAAFFVISAIAFYLRAWKKHDRSRMALAFLAAAGGVVTHYSAVPYAIFLGLHYLIAVFPRRRGRWQELAAIGLPAAIPLAAWFGWCLAIFGAAGTVGAAANTSISYKVPQGGILAKSMANLADSIVPHLLRDWSLVTVWGQQAWLGYLRDNAFLLYQNSLIFTMGVIGGPLVCWLLVGALRRGSGPERSFWLALIPCLVAACFLLAGERDRFGSAHIVLLSLMAIGLTFLAANFTSRRAISLLIAAGCAVDFGLGIFVHARVEHLESSPDPSVFARIQANGVPMDIAPATLQTLSRPTGGNWFRKHQYALANQWLSALNAAHRDGSPIPPAQAKLHKVLSEIVQQDTTLYGGWYQAHHGELTFFGDHFGDSGLTTILLAAGALVILWKLATYAPARVPAAAAVKVKSHRPRKKC
jgi:hypothetical protein